MFLDVLLSMVLFAVIMCVATICGIWWLTSEYREHKDKEATHGKKAQ